MGAAVQIIVFSSPVMIISTTTSFLNSITVHVEALGASLAEDIRSMENWQGEPAIRVYKKHQEIIRYYDNIIVSRYTIAYRCLSGRMLQINIWSN